MYAHRILVFSDPFCLTGLNFTSDYSGILKQFHKIGRAAVYSGKQRSIIIKPCNTLLITIEFDSWKNFTNTAIEYIIMISKLKKPNQPLSTFNLADYPEIFL